MSICQHFLDNVDNIRAKAKTKYICGSYHPTYPNFLSPTSEGSGSVVECLTRDWTRHCVVVFEQDTFILA